MMVGFLIVAIFTLEILVGCAVGHVLNRCGRLNDLADRALMYRAPENINSGRDDDTSGRPSH